MPLSGDPVAAARMAALFESSPVAVGFWDAELRYRAVNPALAAINGLPPEAHLGLTISELLPDIPAHVEDVWRRVLETGEIAVDHAVRGATPAQPGVEREWETTVFPVRGEGGAVVGVGAIVTEVTSLREAQAATRSAQDALAVEREILAAVLDHVPVGVVLFRGRDLRYTIVNRTGKSLLPDRGPLVGKTVEEVYPEALETFAPWPLGVMDTGETRVNPELWLPFDHPTAYRGHRIYQATFSPVVEHGAVGGVLVTYQEVTDTIREREELRAELEAERVLAATLQEALLPRRLATIPHLGLAARYEAAGERNEVGGDFYDLFAGRDDRWLAVVGDVLGKGPRAAARTALARYSLRAEATHADRPAELLALLNADLRRDIEPDDPVDFLTAVLVSAHPTAAGTDLRLALAGHPPPVVVDAEGRCRLLGTPGLPLGLQDEVAYDEVTDVLRPGEALVLYTDGLLDAHAPAVQLSPEDVGRLVAEGPRTPDAIADRLIAHVTGGDAPARDDSALLVLVA